MPSLSSQMGRPGRERKRANAPKGEVRFAPINGRRKRNAACPKGAMDRDRGEPFGSAHRVAGGGRPPPAPTERSMRIYRTTLFGSWFTALQEPATPHMGGAALVSVTASLL
jgi:hypothetical protein